MGPYAGRSSPAPPALRCVRVSKHLAPSGCASRPYCLSCRVDGAAQGPVQPPGLRRPAGAWRSRQLVAGAHMCAGAAVERRSGGQHRAAGGAATPGGGTACRLLCLPGTGRPWPHLPRSVNHQPHTRYAMLHPLPFLPHQSEGGFPDYDADVRSNYLFNSTIAGIDAADAILLVRPPPGREGRFFESGGALPAHACGQAAPHGYQTHMCLRPPHPRLAPTRASRRRCSTRASGRVSAGGPAGWGRPGAAPAPGGPGSWLAHACPSLPGTPAAPGPGPPAQLCPMPTHPPCALPSLRPCSQPGGRAGGRGGQGVRPDVPHGAPGGGRRRAGQAAQGVRGGGLGVAVGGWRLSGGCEGGRGQTRGAREGWRLREPKGGVPTRVPQLGGQLTATPAS